MRFIFFIVSIGLVLMACVSPGDDDTPDMSPSPSDVDGDTPDMSPSPSDVDGDSWSVEDGDCEDSDAAINPGMEESCNGIDDNCDGQVDEDLTQYTFEHDWDADEYGDGVSFLSCSASVTGAILSSESLGVDCDDSDETINPGVEEQADNGIDDDCDGQLDESED